MKGELKSFKVTSNVPVSAAPPRDTLESTQTCPVTLHLIPLLLPGHLPSSLMPQATEASSSGIPEEESSDPLAYWKGTTPLSPFHSTLCRESSQWLSNSDPQKGHSASWAIPLEPQRGESRICISKSGLVAHTVILAHPD